MSKSAEPTVNGIIRRGGDTIDVAVSRCELPKCPRCQRHCGIPENYDGLCDRCCQVMISDWPDHEVTPYIIAALEEQRKKYRKHLNLEQGNEVL